MTDAELAADSYPMPVHGWTCFHCGETFATPGAARDHFGADPLDTAGCQIKVGEERGLQMALRRAEEALRRCQAEDSDAGRTMAVMTADHAVALRRAEEAGYARGLADGRGAGADALAAALAWDEDDRPLPEDAAIRAHHPCENGSDGSYAEAMRLVGARRSKGALVDLVNWLLQRAAAAEGQADG